MAAVHVLHVEDTPEDLLLLQIAFRRARSDLFLHSVRDGNEAIDYLSGAGLYRDRQLYPLPDLILLDLKLPCVSGFDLLAWVRTQPQLQHLPIVVLSGSQRELDERCARDLGASAYLVKTPLYEDVLDVVNRLVTRPRPILALPWAKPASIAQSSQPEVAPR